ncbi:MAG: hypothetical protein ABR899_10600 [Candidatus Krumholzibacteriaceae bacterium]|jgi:hypothetical protein
MNDTEDARERFIRRARLGAACAAIVLVAFGAAGRADQERRIAATLQPTCYIFDSQFFGLSSGFGVDAALRCELGSDIYFENTLGLFKTKGSGLTVDGVDYRLNLLAIFPVLLPYRPVARLGVGFLSVNPVTVTPTSTFRPTQTTFYILGGAGVTRAIFPRVLIDAGAEFWITPYEYRIYRFDRLEVDTQLERFTHISISVGITYAF